MTDIKAEVRKLTLEDGDVIVLRTENWIPDEGKASLGAMLGAIIEKSGKQAQGLILEGGMTIEVLRLSHLQDDDTVSKLDEVSA